MKFIISKTEHGWALVQTNGDSVWPTTFKKTEREIVARLMQLMQTGPLAPQLNPENVCIGVIDHG